MQHLAAKLLAGACAMGLAAGVAADNGISKAAYDAAIANAEAGYAVDRAACEQLGGNAEDICVAKAKARRSASKADAEADYRPTVDTITDSRIARADGEYEIARQKCDEQTGNDKDVCRKDAEALHTAKVAEAKAKGEGASAQLDANEKIRKAEYAAVKERCDAFSGERKDACLAEAKAHFDP